MEGQKKINNQPEHISRIMLRVLSGLFYAPRRIASQDDAGLLSSRGVNYYEEENRDIRDYQPCHPDNQ